MEFHQVFLAIFIALSASPIVFGIRENQPVGFQAVVKEGLQKQADKALQSLVQSFKETKETQTKEEECKTLTFGPEAPPHFANHSKVNSDRVQGLVQIRVHQHVDAAIHKPSWQWQPNSSGTLDTSLITNHSTAKQHDPAQELPAFTAPALTASLTKPAKTLSQQRRFVWGAMYVSVVAIMGGAFICVCVSLWDVFKAAQTVAKEKSVAEQVSMTNWPSALDALKMVGNQMDQNIRGSMPTTSPRLDRSLGVSGATIIDT